MGFLKIVCGISILMGIISIIWLWKVSQLDQHTTNPKISDEMYSFDYVIVGAGTAGSVVSSLLTKHSGKSVLLIEAGSNFGILSKVPLLTTFQQKGVNDWAFKSTSQRHSSMGLENQQQCLPRGKGLGGSAQLNYMLHFGGNAQDFNRWANKYNLTQWRWDRVEPFLKAGEPKSYEILEISPYYSKITESLLHAEDEFVNKPWRFRRPKYNIKNGLRHSVLQRFLQPIKENTNLMIITEAKAKKIELEFDEDGQGSVKLLIVSFLKNGKEQIFKVHIKKELIIAAGTYQSPELLLASGIGNARILSELNIKIQKNLPAVGENLHDHLNVPLYVSIDVVGPTLNQRAILEPLGWVNYLTKGGGHFGNFGVIGHIDSVWEGTFGLTFFGAGAIDEAAFMSISNFKRSHFRALFPRYHNASQEGFVLISSCLQPYSRGWVKLGNDGLQINPNYLADRQDIKCTINAIRAAVEVLESRAFANLRPRIHWPKIRECQAFGPFTNDHVLNMPSSHYLECIIRHIGVTAHHPGGTCSMGTNATDSVVDSQFRVHSIKKLRVIDASVMPTPISGNPNSIVTGMAIRGATMILKENIND